jgi:hypothetical protein
MSIAHSPDTNGNVTTVRCPWTSAIRGGCTATQSSPTQSGAPTNSPGQSAGGTAAPGSGQSGTPAPVVSAPSTSGAAALTPTQGFNGCRWPSSGPVVDGMPTYTCSKPTSGSGGGSLGGSLGASLAANGNQSCSSQNKPTSPTIPVNLPIDPCNDVGFTLV